MKDKFNDLVKKASKNMNSIVGIGKDLLETTKLEQSLNQNYKELGKMLYEKHQSSELYSGDHDLRDECEKITQIIKLIDECKQDVKKKRESIF